MLIFKTTESIGDSLAKFRKEGKKIAFAPTMGALHEGHLSLIKKALDENDVCVTSIFVNPTQFNDKKDLDRYPRPFEHDLELLVKSGAHILFYPEVQEMYPSGLEVPVLVDFGYLLETMEAVFRKGHFEGVSTVVKRLLDIVQPDTLYMGQKDYQQLLIVKYMIAELALPVRLVMCPTVREADGLAMSSRNTLLTPDERAAAALIPQTLFRAKEKAFDETFEEIEQESIEEIDSNPLLKTEYFRIVDAKTLAPAQNMKRNAPIAICTAVKAGSVRLIDNLIIA
ncbi:MAG: pantoate--beta-alanine ligase [Chitinophagales bacterium]|nr:pantoate--beta-alanine ligase [Chitinophagales bacterium]